MSQPRPDVFYAPWRGGYRVSPSLSELGHDFGNGVFDQVLFQFDSTAARAIAAKAAWSEQQLALFRGTDRLSAEAELAITEFLATKIAEDARTQGREVSELSGKSWREMAELVAEDLALVSTDGAEDWVSAIDVRAPSHWRPMEKLGRSFFAVHKPVPEFERVNAAASKLVHAMVHGRPMVRFVWLLETDNDLCQHPDLVDGKCRKFRPGGPLFVRTERQSTWGLPGANAALFAIRVHTFAFDTLAPEDQAAILKAVQGMSAAALEYHGYSGATMEALWAACAGTLSF